MELYRRLYRFIRRISYLIILFLYKNKKYIPSKTPIDVAIMVLEKDLEILPLCIEGIKKCVNQTINNIHVISPDSYAIKIYCQNNGLEWHEESSILNYAPNSIQLVIDNENRSGWLFQQLVKLSGRIGDSRYTLFIDADHVLLKPHVFLTNCERPVFYMSKEFNLPYYENIRSLLQTPLIIPPCLSYVAHKMLFDKEKLLELHRLLEMKYPGKSWDQVIISLYDRSEKSGFSEFELYGYLYGRKGFWLPWDEHRLKYSMKREYCELEQRFSTFKSVTFPSFLN